MAASRVRRCCLPIDLDAAQYDDGARNPHSSVTAFWCITDRHGKTDRAKSGEQGMQVVRIFDTALHTQIFIVEGDARADGQAAQNGRGFAQIMVQAVAFFLGRDAGADGGQD